MMNTPNWDAPTGHQSGQENKHTHTHHQIRARQRRDKTDMPGRLMERLRRLSIKTPGRITTISHGAGNKQGQSDILNFFKEPTMEQKCGVALVKYCHPTTGVFYVVIY